MPEDPTLEAPAPGDAVGAVASLGEPTRRALYEYVVGARDWVARDTAADAVGLERGTAAHHLDRLAADGLLDVDYQRRSGRRGPGAGRPAKLYRRARRDIDVSLPPRAYELAGRLLAEAADTSRVEGIDITSALDVAARAEGRRLADEMRARLRAIGAPAGTPARRARCARRPRLRARARPTTTRSCCTTARSTHWPSSTPT